MPLPPETVRHLNVAGLALTTIAAALMYWFPAEIQEVTKDGLPVMKWTANAGDDATKKKLRRKARLHACMRKLGPALLFFGFVLLLIAAYFG